jgi:hypothetical protein
MPDPAEWYLPWRQVALRYRLLWHGEADHLPGSRISDNLPEGGWHRDMVRADTL